MKIKSACFNLNGDNSLIGGGWVMVFNATFNNISVTCISWQSVFIGGGNRIVLRENH